jgi:hypothetical protein
VEIRADADSLVQLGKALRKEEDGKELRRDLIRALKVPLVPAVAEIKSGLLSMSSGSLRPGKESLRRAAARKVTTQVKLSGFAAGVRVRARKTPAVRGFANAPKRLNQAKGWRHRVFGRNTWVIQFGKPHYFDDPLRHRRAEFRAAVVAAMNDTARRIADRAQRG